MPIPVQCPKCGKQYQAPDKLAGKAVQCGCGAKLVVSAPAAVPQASLQNWYAEELDALEKKKQDAALEAAAKAERAAAAEAKAKTKTRRRAPAGSLKRDVIGASIFTAVSIGIVTLILVGVGIYVSKNPSIPLARPENARKLGSGVGTLMSFIIAIPWLMVAFRHRKRKEAE